MSYRGLLRKLSQRECLPKESSESVFGEHLTRTPQDCLEGLSQRSVSREWLTACWFLGSIRIYQVCKEDLIWKHLCTRAAKMGSQQPPRTCKNLKMPPWINSPFKVKPQHARESFLEGWHLHSAKHFEWTSSFVHWLVRCAQQKVYTFFFCIYIYIDCSILQL